MSKASRIAIIKSFAKFNKHGRILDVGCGVGLFLDQAKSLGWETYGTEIGPEAIAVCEAAGHSMGMGALVAQDYPDGFFDVVIYSEVIEHITNQPEEFDRVWSLLRPGGLLYITTPNFDGLSRRLLGAAWNVIEYPEHLVFFSPVTLRGFLVKQGFSEGWLETTGLSFSRAIQSARAKWQKNVLVAPVEPSGPIGKSRAIDTGLRAILASGRIGPISKKTINRFLSFSKLGDTIKCGFIKVDRAGTSEG